MLSEFGSLGFESVVVLGEFLGNGSFKWVVGVGVFEQSDQRFNQEFGVQCWDPVVLNSLRADVSSVLLDIWMVNLSHELDLWAFEWV